MPLYDATNPHFLPVISALFATLLSILPPAFGPAQDPGPKAAASAVESAAEVGVGSGDVAPAVIGGVKRLVVEQIGELLPVFPGLRLRPFFVRVHESRETMPEPLTRYLHPGSAGFALLGQRQVHLVWGEIRRLGTDPRGVVTHELVHELLDQYVVPHGNRMPRWFHEGLAQLLAGDTYLGGREEDLLWRLAARRVLSFADLRERFPSDADDLQAAYAQSYSYVAWLSRQYSVADLLVVAKNVDRETSFEEALVGRTGRTTLQLEDGWRFHLHNESGAAWRVLLDQCFNILLIASLPLLLVAVVRRFARERRAAEQLARSEAASPLLVEFEALPVEEDFSAETAPEMRVATPVETAAPPPSLPPVEPPTADGGAQDRTP